MSTREWVVLYIMHKDGVIPITGGVRPWGPGTESDCGPATWGGALSLGDPAPGPGTGGGADRTAGCPRRAGSLPGWGPISLEKWGKEHQGLRPLDPGGFYWPLAVARSFFRSQKLVPSVEP